MSRESNPWLLCFNTLCNLSRKLASSSLPIRSNVKTNCDFASCVFLPFMHFAFFTRSAYLLSMILSMLCLAIVLILAFHRFTTLNWLKCAQCLSTFDSRVFHICASNVWLSANQWLTKVKKEWTWWSFCVYY